MPTYARTPWGVAVQNDDGTAGFLPPELVPPEGAGAGEIPQDFTLQVNEKPARAQGVTVPQPDGSALYLPPELAHLAATQDFTGALSPASEAASLRDQQSASPVPDIARDNVATDIKAGIISPPTARGLTPAPNSVQMEGEDISAGGGTPEEQAIMLESQQAEQARLDALGIGPPDPANDALVAADLARSDITPTADAGAPTGDQGSPTPQPTGQPPMDPYEAKAIAAETAGAAAAQAAQAQADLMKARDADADKIEAQRAEARALSLKHRQDLEAAYTLAVQKQSDFDMRTPEKSTSDKMRNLIAIMLGGIGAALDRKGGPNSVLPIIQAQAEEEAAERSRMYGQLRDSTAGAASLIEHADQLSTSQESFYQGQLATVYENTAREFDHQGQLATVADVKARAAVAAADARIKRDAAAAAAAAAEQEHQLKLAKQVTDDKLAVIAGKNADVGEYRAKTDRQQVYINDANTDARLTFDSGKSDIDQDQWQKDYDLRVKTQADKAAADLLAAGGDKPALDRIRKDVQQNLDARRLRPLTVATVKTDPATGKRTIEATTRPLMNAPEPWIDPYGQPILDANGKQIVAPRELIVPDEDAGKVLRKKMGAVENYVRVLDNMINIVEAEGFSSDTLKSDAWLRAKQAWADAAVQYKGPEMAALGVIAGADLPLMAAAIGTGDPTQIRSSMAGAKQSRASSIAALNLALKNEGRYTGEDIEFPNIATLPGGELSEAAKLTRSISSDDDRSDEISGRTSRLSTGVPKDGPLAGIGPADRIDPAHVLTSRQADGVQKLVELSKSEDKAVALDAKAQLVELAKRPGYGPAVVDFLVVNNVDLSDVDEDTADRVLNVMRTDGLPLAKQRTIDNLGVGGIAAKAAAVGGYPRTKPKDK